MAAALFGRQFGRKYVNGTGCELTFASSTGSLVHACSFDPCAAALRHGVAGSQGRRVETANRHGQIRRQRWRRNSHKRPRMTRVEKVPLKRDGQIAGSCRRAVSGGPHLAAMGVSPTGFINRRRAGGRSELIEGELGRAGRGVREPAQGETRGSPRDRGAIHLVCAKSVLGIQAQSRLANSRRACGCVSWVRKRTIQPDRRARSRRTGESDRGCR